MVPISNPSVFCDSDVSGPGGGRRRPGRGHRRPRPGWSRRRQATVGGVGATDRRATANGPSQSPGRSWRRPTGCRQVAAEGGSSRCGGVIGKGMQIVLLHVKGTDYEEPGARQIAKRCVASIVPFSLSNTLVQMVLGSRRIPSRPVQPLARIANFGPTRVHSHVQLGANPSMFFRCPECFHEFTLSRRLHSVRRRSFVP